MFNLSTQTLLIFAAAIAVGLFTAARQPGGILAAVARGSKGFVIRGVLALAVFGAITAYVSSEVGSRTLGTKDPLEHAKVGDCVAGMSKDTTRLVGCDDAFAKSKIVKIFQDTTPGAAMTPAACGGVPSADGAFMVTDLTGGADRAVAYCTKSL